MAMSILSEFTPPAGVELRPEPRNDIVTEQKASGGNERFKSRLLFDYRKSFAENLTFFQKKIQSD